MEVDFLKGGYSFFLFAGIPKERLKIHNLVFNDFYALRLQELLHGTGASKVVLASEEALSIYHPMRRKIVGNGFGVVQRPSHHAGTSLGSQKRADSPVGRHSAVGYPGYNFVHTMVKVSFYGMGICNSFGC